METAKEQTSGITFKQIKLRREDLIHLKNSISKGLRKTILPIWILNEKRMVHYPNKKKRLETASIVMEWLCLAQAKGGNGGVSTAYDIRKGWLPSFPETTGYIISTFMDYYHLTKELKYYQNAIKMLDWLLTVQTKEGAIPGVSQDAYHPIVFDTGMVIFGLLRGFEETKENNYFNAAQKAGEWLVKNQEEDGKWKNYEYLGHIHVYNTRVAWALAELFKATHSEVYKKSAIKNIAWAIKQQKENGWFSYMAFSPDQPVYSHTIAYTIRGILECGYLFKNEPWINHARKTADALMQQYYKNNFLHGSYDDEWNPTTKSSCLTGNSQMAINWLRLYQITHNENYLESASRILDVMVQKVNRSKWFNFLNGSISGSYPIDGNYLPWMLPNWAPKFFIDAILLENQILKKTIIGS